MIKICEYCGKEFETNREIKRFCCRQCKEKSKQSRKCKGIRLDNIEYTKVCPVCNTEFITTHQDKKYCSDKCRDKSLSEYRANNTKKWYQANKDKPEYKAKSMMYQMLMRCNGKTTCKNIIQFLGYTPSDLINRLESQFKPDMNWNNYGVLWELDHIKPIGSYTFVDKNGKLISSFIKEANSLSNLRPIYIAENMRKSSWYNGVLYRKGKPVKIKGDIKTSEGVL